MPMNHVARQVGAWLAPAHAQVLIGHRLRTLQRAGVLPMNWQRAYHRTPHSTTSEGYKLEEDVELLQWAATGKSLIDCEVFVESNRSAEGLRARCHWLASLPRLVEKAVRIEEEALTVQWVADQHWVLRDQMCERCDQELTATFYENLGEAA